MTEKKDDHSEVKTLIGTPENMTLEEEAAHQRLAQSGQNLGQAMLEYFKKVPNLDMLGMQANIHMLQVQLDITLELLTASGAIKRLDLWTKCADQINEIEANYKRALLNVGVIQQARGFRPGHGPGNLPKKN